MSYSVSSKREKKIKLQKTFQSIFVFLYFALCGFVGGFLFADVTNNLFPGQKRNALMAAGVGIGILLLLYICITIHMYLHECGHLIFGLISGYSFQSIRFGSLILVKEGKKVKIAKYTLAGTGGQCLMTPPDIPCKDLPTDLYNWGGIIINIILSVIFGVLFISFPQNAILRLASGLMVMVGIFIAVMNGVPLEALGNDGYNAIHLKKDLHAKKAFVTQLLVVSEYAKNHSILDMPAEWFDWEYDENDCALAMGQGAMRLSRLISECRIKEAYDLSKLLLDKADALIEIHQTIVYSENLCCRIWLGMDKDEIARDFDAKKKNILVLRQIPSIQRLLYLYYSFVEKDDEKASEAMATFDKIAAKYPYPAEIQDERNLLRLTFEELV